MKLNIAGSLYKVLLYTVVYRGDAPKLVTYSDTIITENIFPASSVGAILETRDLSIGLITPPKHRTTPAGKRIGAG